MADPLISVEVGDTGEISVSPDPGALASAETTEYIPVQNLLNIQNPSGKERQQLKEVYDYLAPKANGTGDLLYQLRQLENRMGPPKLGESRLGKLFNYIALQNNITQLEQQRDSL